MPKQTPLMMAITLLLVISSFFAGPVHADTTVYFIGNSFTATYDVPTLFSSLASSGGYTAQTSGRIIGGYSLSQHWSDGVAQAAITNGSYDYVILQENSTLAYDSTIQTGFNTTAPLFDAVATNSGAQTMFYMTWVREDQLATLTNGIALYRNMAEQLGAQISPVGIAWQRVRDQHPTLDLYDADRHHPNPKGAYLASCCFYGAIFDNSPEDLTMRTVSGITLNPLDAAILQRIAWDAVQYVSFTNPPVISSMTVDQAVRTNSTPFAFEAAASDNGSITDYLWDFGDGVTTNGAALTNASHTYSTDGIYQVTVTVTDNSGETERTGMTVTFDTTGPQVTTITASSSTLMVYFNQGIQSNGANTAANYAISDGISVISATQVTSNTVQLGVSTLSAGVQYVLTLNNLVSETGTDIFPNTTANFMYVDESDLYLRFDFGSTNYTTPGNWNNITYGGGGLVISNAVDIYGTQRDIGLRCTPSSTSNSGYVSYGIIASNLYPASVQRDCVYNTKAFSYQIEGANPSAQYQLTLFASKNAATRETLFSVGSSNIVLDTAYNTNLTAVFEGIQSDTNGTILFTVTTNTVNSSGFCYLSAMELKDTTPVLYDIEADYGTLNVAEGTTNSFQIRLTHRPSGSVTVNVIRASGDVEINPVNTSVVFTTNDWSAWQTIHVLALQDGDTTNGVAIIRCSDAAGFYTLVDITVTELDDDGIPVAPVADNQIIRVQGNTPTNLVLTATDTDSTSLTYSILNSPSHGTLSGLDANTGDVTYTPTLDYTGADSFTFNVSDGALNSTGTVSITVTEPPIPTAPIYFDFGSSTYPTPGNWNNINSTAVDLLITNALDSDGVQRGIGLRMLQPSITVAFSSGTAATNLYPDTAQRDCVYSTKPFYYQIEGADPAANYQLTFFASKNAALRETLYSSSGSNVVLDTSYNTDRTAVIENVQADTNGYIVFTITTNGVNSSGFCYLSVLELQQIIEPIAPIADDLAVTTAEDTATNLLMTATDDDSVYLTYSILSAPTNGTLSGLNAANGTLTYTPSGDYNGADSFTFMVDDGALASTGTVSITVTAVNDAPIANSRNLMITGNSSTNVTLTASDADNTNLTYAIVSGPTNGTLSGLNANTGAVTYTPDTDYSGLDSFTFSASDGTLSSTGTINFAVTAPPTPAAPIYFDFGSSTYPTFGNWNNITSTDVALLITNALDSEGVQRGFGLRMLQPSVTVAFSYGTAATNLYPDTAQRDCVYSTKPFYYQIEGADPAANYRLTFFASKNATLRETLYSIGSSNAVLDAAYNTDQTAVIDNVQSDTNGIITFTITTNGVNSSGFCYLSVLELQDMTPTAPGGLLANDQNITTDEDSATNLVLTADNAFGNLTYAIVSGPINGSLNGLDTETGAVAYTPAANYSGTDSFTFSADDGFLTSTGTVTITVTAVNDAPVAGAGSNQSVADQDDDGSQSITLDGSGSIDSDGTIVSYIWTEGASQLASGTNQTITLPVGVHTITLTVTDNGSLTGSNDVTVTVTEPVRTATFQIVSSTDDAAADETYTGELSTTMYWPYSSTSRMSFLRWKSMIPKGATITEAYVKVRANGVAGDSNSSVIRLQVLDSGNVANFLTTANPYSSAVMSNYVDSTLPGTWTTNQWYSSDDITSILQAFIDRSDYAYGNYIGVRGSFVSGSWKRAYTWDYDDHSSAPQLEVHYTGGETILQLWMADPETRLGQKVYCQIANRHTTDSLRVKLDGNVIYTKSAPLSSTEEVFTVDYRNLGAGSHTLLVEILEADGTLRTAASRTWIKLHEGIAKVAINEHNAICRDGVPFFPITPWGIGTSSLSTTWEGQINTLCGQSFGIEKNLDSWVGFLEDVEAANYPIMGPAMGDFFPGGYTGHISEVPAGSSNYVAFTSLDMDRVAEYINASKDSSALLMYVFQDEPDLGGATEYIPATEVRRWTDLCHELDTERLHYLNLVGYPFTGAPPYPNYGNQRAKSYCFLYNDQQSSAMGTNMPFAEKTLVADVLAFDYYPYERALWPSNVGWIGLPDLALALDRLSDWNYDLAPVMTWIETCDINESGSVGYETPAPTPEQLNNLIWLSIIHEVKGIQWFHYFQETPVTNRLVMKTATEWITVLTQPILSPAEDVTWTVTEEELGNEQVDIMTREYNDQLYIFSAHMISTGAGETVRFNMTGLTNGAAIGVLGESRTLTAGNGYFEDTFSPLAVHIYTYPALTNMPPVSKAGVDQLVSDNNLDGYETITLSDDSSFDADGTLVSYVWMEGSTQLATGTTAQVSFATGQHTVSLVVTDNGGSTGSNTVTITVNPPPVAHAGADQEVNDTDNDGIELITLDGSSSSDALGNIVSYVWTEGGNLLSTGVTAQVSLFADTHDILLEVTDDNGATGTDTVQVIVVNSNVVNTQYQISASADDTYATTNTSSYINSTMYFPYTTTARLAFLRWSIDVPVGSTILSADLQVKSTGNKGDTNPSTVRLELLDSDSAPNFSSTPYYSAVTATTEDWVLPAGDWAIGQWYTSGNIKALVQEFVDRTGYTTNNYIGMRCSNVSGLWKQAYQWDSGAHTDGAILRVTYLPPATTNATYTLIYTAGANGTISGTTPQTVSEGADGSAVLAIASGGYHFVNWSDSSTQNPRTDTNITNDVSVTASFAINTYTLTYAAGTNGTISGITSQTVNYTGSGSTVTAIPDTGYYFVDWSDSVIDNPRTDINVTDNIAATANFSNAGPGYWVTEYYLTTNMFTGTNYTLTLDQPLADDYFILVRGSRIGDSLSNPDNNYARVSAIPGGRGDLPDSGTSNTVILSRHVADVTWEGVVTVVECMNTLSPDGFKLLDIVETGMTSTSGVDTSSTAWSDVDQVVLFGGYRGGGSEMNADATAAQGVAAFVRLYPSGSNTLNWARDAGGETLLDASMTTFVIEWGSAWNIQHVNVSGSSGGSGANTTNEYATASVNSVTRDNTWVWGTGTRTDAGAGDSAEGCLITLGDGVNQNTNETTVAVGSEYTDAYDFDVYTMTHPILAVDHRFKVAGDIGALDLDVTVDTSTNSFARFGWVYNGVASSADYQPRSIFWARFTGDSTVTISRGNNGTTFPAWVQAIDFSSLDD